MKHRTKFIVLSVLLILMIWLDIRAGSVFIPHDAFRDAIFHPDGSTVYRNIIFQYRIPKMLTAVLAGSGLALAGLLLQTMFRNPIVGPYVLGISSGAGLAVALMLTVTAAGHLSGNPYLTRRWRAEWRYCCST